MSRNYNVGYGRPPLASRFQPGRSGNPAGRPKGSRSLSTVLAAALSERVTVTENGRRRSLTKFEAAAKQLANKAAGGDRHAIKLALDLLHLTELRDDARAGGAPLSQEAQRESDLVILGLLRDRALHDARESDNDD
jgi:hypothetical protein